jgi:hypothetical protein
MIEDFVKVGIFGDVVDGLQVAAVSPCARPSFATLPARAAKEENLWLLVLQTFVL